MMFYVRINHLTDEQLAFFGYTLVEEDEEMQVYKYYDGTLHVVEREGHRFLWVEDVNDAVALNSSEMVHFPV